MQPYFVFLEYEQLECYVRMNILEIILVLDNIKNENN